MIDVPNSYLARRNPVLKLGVLLALSLSLTSFFDPVTPAAFAVLAVVATCLLGRVRLVRIARALVPVTCAGAGIILANLLFGRGTPDDRVLAELGPLTLSEGRLLLGTSIAVRIVAFAALSLCFVFTTDPGAFLLSLIQQLHLNYRIAFGVLVAYRMLPLLQSEYRHIRDAQRARGLTQDRGPLDLRELRRYAVPLMAGAVRRASRVALAMDARAFGAFPLRTFRQRLRVTRADWAFALGAVVAGVMLVGVLYAAGITRFGVGV